MKVVSQKVLSFDSVKDIRELPPLLQRNTLLQRNCGAITVTLALIAFPI
jgi:hypothetical protein